jgi:WD40 repeat protein
MSRNLAFASIAAAALVGGAAAREQAQAGLVPLSASVTLPVDITSITAITGSSTIAVGLADGRVAVWGGEDKTAARILNPHGARVLAVGSTADGREVWSVATDGSLARTPLAPGGLSTARRLELGPARTGAAAFAADGSMLVTGAEFGEIRVFDTASGALRHQLRGHRTELQSVADLRLWDAASGRQIGLVEGDLSLFALGFSPRDGTLASGGVDRRLTLRNPTTFKALRQVVLKAPLMVGTLAWSQDGRFIALGDLDDETLSKGGLQVLDAGSRAVVARLDTGGVPAGGLAFLGDSRVLVAIVGRDLRAWTVGAIK